MPRLRADRSTRVVSAPAEPPASPLTDYDLYLFRQGSHRRLYDKLGAHLLERGTRFAVWAPNAASVAVVGDWNDWDGSADPLAERADGSGIWEGIAPDARAGARYKYRIVSRHQGYRADKSDPFAFAGEVPPRTASMIAELAYVWGDGEWMRTRAARNALDAPVSIYEVHLGSWRP
jgi:1,4-alpha-glucan branching enzyme